MRAEPNPPPLEEKIFTKLVGKIQIFLNTIQQFLKGKGKRYSLQQRYSLQCYTEERKPRSRSGTLVIWAKPTESASNLGLVPPCSCCPGKRAHSPFIPLGMCRQRAGSAPCQAVSLAPRAPGLLLWDPGWSIRSYKANWDLSSSKITQGRRGKPSFHPLPGCPQHLCSSSQIH